MDGNADRITACTMYTSAEQDLDLHVLHPRTTNTITILAQVARFPPIKRRSKRPYRRFHVLHRHKREALHEGSRFSNPVTSQ
jgi:hypothetical protein